MNIRLKDPMAKAAHLSVALLQDKRMLCESRAEKSGIQDNSKAGGLFSACPGKGERVVSHVMNSGQAVQIAIPRRCPADAHYADLASGQIPA